jgi:hypothetical protein
VIRGRNKYNNRRTTIDGITFSSAREAKRYCELKILQRVGKITDLQLQPRFPIVIGDQKVCTYVGDFSYREQHAPDLAGPVVIEDAKGVRTDIYKLKKRLMRAVHGVEIVEV